MQGQDDANLVEIETLQSKVMQLREVLREELNEES